MVRAAQIENGQVVNIILVGSLAGRPGLVDATGARIGDVWDGQQFSAPPPPPLDETSAAEALREIDALCDAKRNRYVSTGSLVVEEYRLAAQQARAYKQAGYSGNVPATVQAWAAAKGWTAQEAADNIIAVELAWMQVLAAIRAIRLPAKEQVRAATTRTQVEAVLEGVRAALDGIPEV